MSSLNRDAACVSPFPNKVGYLSGHKHSAFLWLNPRKRCIENKEILYASLQGLPTSVLMQVSNFQIPCAVDTGCKLPLPSLQNVPKGDLVHFKLSKILLLIAGCFLLLYLSLQACTRAFCVNCSQDRTPFSAPSLPGLLSSAFPRASPEPFIRI